MLEKYYLRYKDKIIGTFLIKDNSKKYRPVHETARSIPEGLGYPLGMFPLDVQADGINPVKNYNPTEEDIEFWLSERVFPPEREGAEELLKNIGIDDYNVWEVAKHTNAATSHDFYWMSQNPNDRYEDIHPRVKHLNFDSKKSSVSQKVLKQFKDIESWEPKNEATEGIFTVINKNKAPTEKKEQSKKK
ncbi:hypothetical protein [Paenibacillus polymyxa]|uniref:hypothetical protein n=1 Tax=Paenibacillus polymyxa TaxID=1406 RepID=UPI002ED482F3|nr:hypothetical protein [Paenibacillus polymyxa]